MHKYPVFYTCCRDMHPAYQICLWQWPEITMISSLDHFPEDQDRSNYFGTLSMYHPFSWIIIHPHQLAHLSDNLDHPLTWSINFNIHTPFGMLLSISLWITIWSHHSALNMPYPFSIAWETPTMIQSSYYICHCESPIDPYISGFPFRVDHPLICTDWHSCPICQKSKPQIDYPTMLAHLVVKHFVLKEKSYF